MHGEKWCCKQCTFVSGSRTLLFQLRYLRSDQVTPVGALEATTGLHRRELSVSQRELMLRVRCRLELLCLAGRSGHCLRRPPFSVALCFLAASTDGTAGILMLLFYIRGKYGAVGPFYNYSAVYSFLLCYNLKALNKACRKVLLPQHTEPSQICLFSYLKVTKRSCATSTLITKTFTSPTSCIHADYF